MFVDAIQIGMAELKVTQAPEKLASLGLGSCIAVCAYDQAIKVGGLAHVMLPDSSIFRENFNPGKFGDTAVPFLVREMVKLGAIQSRIQVIIVGGAHMFAFKSEDSLLDIGVRNIQSVEEACVKIGIPIVARSVGGKFGRSVLFDLNTGKVYVRTINQGTVELSMG
ncbi:MAG TPA: chemotaxis protein CheD [Bacillota bacterium]|nr:chemotaxis protein CheD [Bacillota bacterium]